MEENKKAFEDYKKSAVYFVDLFFEQLEKGEMTKIYIQQLLFILEKASCRGGVEFPKEFGVDAMLKNKDSLVCSNCGEDDCLSVQITSREVVCGTCYNMWVI